ncbi:hypothetical protein QUW02_13360 [Bacteroides eggerthii]|uniref:Transmembrane protein n=1 Tax=Bacteroides eggerthii TaxID=28111 RepID=A0ABT7U8Q1_9BACE|nr:hypothetical protein [Bacteroides eggerthii]
MKTFLCWGISKLEGLAALLVCFTMGILAANETRILHEEQLNVNGWILLITALAGAAIPAIITAIYAVKNFDEVTSYCKKRSRLLQQKRRCCYSSDVAKLMFSS